MPRARIAAYTAPPAAVVAALDSLRAAHGVPDAFPEDALREARAAAAAWEDGGAERFLRDGHADGVPVRDARDLPLVTIDPPGSMDLDQAVLLQRIGADGADGGAGRWRVFYAIASLSTFVTPDGALDAELRRRGETIYAPDVSTPLHPTELSHGTASLLPGVDRPCYLWTIDLDAVGAVTAAHVERALVRSRARLTYAQVQAALDDGAAVADRLPADVPGDLPESLRAVGHLCQQREAARGGVSLTTPEQEIALVDDADPASGYHLTYRAGLPVEGWNAQISLLTGICAARLMTEARVGILRTLPPADSGDYARLRRIAAALGVDWPAKVSYPALVRRLDSSRPGDAAFTAQATSLFRGAGYLAFGVDGVAVPTSDHESATDEAVHAAIAERYAHVTAPLRRLVDRYGLEVCAAACAGAPVPGWVRAALPELPEVMAQAGRRSRAVERGAVSAVEALVLDGHVGEVFDGVLLSARQGRGEVMLAEPAVVADVRLDGHDDAREAQDPAVGEAVKVRLVEADVVHARTTFTLLR